MARLFFLMLPTLLFASLQTPAFAAVQSGCAGKTTVRNIHGERWATLCLQTAHRRDATELVWKPTLARPVLASAERHIEPAPR